MLLQGIFLSLLQCPEAKKYTILLNSWKKYARHSLDTNAERPSSWTGEMRQALDGKVCEPQVYPGKSKEGVTSGASQGIRVEPTGTSGMDAPQCPRPGRQGDRMWQQVGSAGHADLRETDSRLRSPSHLSDQLSQCHGARVEVTLCLIMASERRSSDPSNSEKL